MTGPLTDDERAVVAEIKSRLKKLNSREVGYKQFAALPMDLTTILKTLRREREQVEEVILALEELARGTGKRRRKPRRPPRSKRAGAALRIERPLADALGRKRER